MNKSKILIVEDDPASALTLESTVFELGFSNICHTDDSNTALQIIKENTPDLILMDIDIKGELNGIEVAERVKKLQIPIIFITGLDNSETHQEAKQSKPHAYLIKPFNSLTLETAIDNALKASKKRASASEEWEEDLILKDCFFVKNGTILQKVKFTEIYWIHSEGNYCILYTEQKKHAIRISLSRIIQRLPADVFVRVHQRYVVQVALIDRIDTFNGEVFIKEETIPLGRTYKDSLLDVLNKI